MTNMLRSHTPRRTEISKIPPFPSAANRVVRLLSLPSPRMQEVVDAIQGDAGLCARIVKCANSPQYALRTPVDTVSQAVMVLGFDEMKKIAITMIAADYLGPALDRAETRNCWNHSLASAILADQVAGAAGLAADHCYIAGLLHDLGRLALLAHEPEDYAWMLRHLAPDADLLAEEEHQFGFSHLDVGRMLASEWRLPREVILAARYHHDPVRKGELDTVGVVQIACRLSSAMGRAAIRPEPPGRVEEILEVLPPRVRARLPRDGEDWSRSLGDKLGAYLPNA